MHTADKSKMPHTMTMLNTIVTTMMHMLRGELLHGTSQTMITTMLMIYNVVVIAEQNRYHDAYQGIEV